MVPTSDGGDDGVRVLGPMEGLWLGIGLGDEAVDSFPGARPGSGIRRASRAELRAGDYAH